MPSYTGEGSFEFEFEFDCMGACNNFVSNYISVGNPLK